MDMLGPVAQQRKLRMELRRARERQKLTQKEVADEFGWHSSKVIRIEAGAVNVDLADLRALLALYQVTDRDVIKELVEAAKISKERVWWDADRKNLSPDFLTYLGFESASIRVRQFQSLFVPGLFQTPAYARAIFTSFNSDPATIEVQYRVRMERRRRLLEEENDREMFVVLDEGAVRRQVGRQTSGPEVMIEQLTALKELAARPHITIQIVPFSAGEHLGMNGSFTIFEFPSEEEDFAVFAQQTYRDVLVRDAEENATYLQTFFDLERVATPPGDFDDLIDKIIAEMNA